MRSLLVFLILIAAAGCDLSVDEPQTQPFEAAFTFELDGASWEAVGVVTQWSSILPNAVLAGAFSEQGASGVLPSLTLPEGVGTHRVSNDPDSFDWFLFNLDLMSQGPARLFALPGFEIAVARYDTQAGLIEGTFQGRVASDSTLLSFSPLYPDTLAITNGRFRVPIPPRR